MIKFAGVQLRLHPLFVVVILLSVLTGYFIEVFTLFAVVLIHELGHYAAAKTFKWRIRAIALLPFGGVVEVDEQGGVPTKEEIAVALAGPLQNALMIALSWLFQSFGLWDEAWGNYFIQVNVMIGLFNLLPVLPLDGGKVLQSLLSLHITYHRSLRIGILVSLLFSLFMIVFALIHVGSSGVQLNLLMIGVFLLYSNGYAYRQLPFHFMRFLMNRGVRSARLIEQGALAQPIVVGKHRTIAHIVHLFMKDRYHLVYIMNEQGNIQLVLPEQRLLSVFFMHHQPGSAVSELFM